MPLTNEELQSMFNDYKLIPMSEITPEAREISKRWYDGVSEMNDIREKHKLASDIMNYARHQVEKERERSREEIQSLKDEVDRLRNIVETTFFRGVHSSGFRDEKSWDQFKQTNKL